MGINLLLKLFHIYVVIHDTKLTIYEEWAPLPDSLDRYISNIRVVMFTLFLLTLLHSERPKLYGVLAILSAIVLIHVYFKMKSNV